MNDKIRNPLRWMTYTALLSALAAVLQFFELSVPFTPSMLKLEFSDLPALTAAFLVGPLSGIVVELLKNCVHLLFTWSMGVGELCNFLLGVLFVLPAGLICRKKRSLKGAVLGAMIGTVTMAVGSVPINGLISYPFYASVMMPMEVIMEMYQALIPEIQNLWQALCIFNLPFTALKGLCAAAVALPLYRSLSPALRKTHMEIQA